MYKKKISLIVGGLILVVILGAGLSWWLFLRSSTTSDGAISIEELEAQSEEKSRRAKDAIYLDTVVPFDTKPWHDGVVIGTQTLYMTDLLNAYVSLYPAYAEYEKMKDIAKWQEAASVVQNSAILIDEAVSLGFDSSARTDDIATASAFLSVQLAIKVPRESIKDVLARRSKEKVTLQSAQQ